MRYLVLVALFLTMFGCKREADLNVQQPALDTIDTVDSVDTVDTIPVDTDYRSQYLGTYIGHETCGSGTVNITITVQKDTLQSDRLFLSPPGDFVTVDSTGHFTGTYDNWFPFSGLFSQSNIVFSITTPGLSGVPQTCTYSGHK